MTDYSTLAPADALTLWGQVRQAIAAKYGIDLSNPTTAASARGIKAMSADDSAEFGAETLAKQNPQAWSLMKTGADTPGDDKTRQVFNPNTGDFEDQTKKGYWSHPESWIQLAAGAGMGAGVGLAAAGAANVGAQAPTVAGAFGPMAGGYAGATTEALIPAALDPAITSFAIPTAAEIAGGGSAAADAAKQIADQKNKAPDTSTVGSLLKQLQGGNTSAAVISALATLLGTHMANSAASDSQKTQADALKYSTDIQDAAAKRNEAFLRQQSENAYLNTEATRRANYDQWRAREGRVSNLGAALGLGQRDIPNYVPGVDPRFTVDTTTTTIPGRASGGPVDQGQPYVVGENGPEVIVPKQNGTVMPNQFLATNTGGGGLVNTGWDPNTFAAIVGRPPTQAESDYYSKRGTGWIDEVRSNTPGGGGPVPTTGGSPSTPSGGGGTYNDLMAALTSNYQSLGATPTGPGTGPTDISYFARRIQETGGMTPQNQAYWFGPKGRIAMELAGAVPPEGAASTPANVPGGASGAPGSVPGPATDPRQYANGSLGDIVQRTNYWWT